ncbi:uncharacterized protein [Oryza sativa Japonica Group]|uniref:uncharacterized protein isoform X4 n=1 Tax=Oryza sativa subsp. japonica TaxID=39947 RepID=UPI000E1B72EC|nr:uncharacterized protein LOC4335209 isoform X4 [Oryza sativa Japonica Group]
MDDSGSSSPPAPAPSFRNRYWILRHGRSVPNERGIIVSSLENGTKPEFGLAPQGVEQARLAGESLRKELEELGVPLDSVQIRYSPFSRTMETAREVARVLGVPFDTPSCIPAVELRERYFGPSHELLSHEKPTPPSYPPGSGYLISSWLRYAEVWAVDEVDPLMAPDGGESVADVATRFSQFLSAAEMELHGSAILIVSHGDPLQIFQAVLKETKENPSSLDEVRWSNRRDISGQTDGIDPVRSAAPWRSDRWWRQATTVHQAVRPEQLHRSDRQIYSGYSSSSSPATKGTTAIEERKLQWQHGDKTNNTVASGFGAFSRQAKLVETVAAATH